MKKLKLSTLLCLGLIASVLFSGCNLFFWQNTQAVEAGEYGLVEIIKQHNSPCDYHITTSEQSDDVLPYTFMLAAYNNTTINITKESDKDKSGNFEITLSSAAQENDEYFKFLTGTFTVDGKKITFKNENKQMVGELEDDLIKLTVHEFKSQKEDHEGHDAKLIFVFKMTVEQQ